MKHLFSKRTQVNNYDLCKSYKLYKPYDLSMLYKNEPFLTLKI